MVATALDHVVTMIFLEAGTEPLWTIPFLPADFDFTQNLGQTQISWLIIS
jgi:hypothetical protein